MSAPSPDPSRPEPRARPQYGEYASAEEQRARIREPLPEHPTAAAAATPASAPPVDPAWAAPAPTAQRSGTHPADRIATIALLVYGAVNVAFSVVSYLDFPAFLSTLYRSMGVPGTFTNVDAGRTCGAIAVVALVVGYAIMAWLAVRRLRRGRSAWWIPLVGAVATMIVVCACVMVAILGDPAFVDFARRS